MVPAPRRAIFMPIRLGVAHGVQKILLALRVPQLIWNQILTACVLAPLVEDHHAGGSDPTAITVFGYCHAFERWFEIPQSFDPVGANSGPTAASIDVDDSGNSNATQVPSDREYRVYQIVGVDRVAFVGNDSLANVFAACSTF